MARKRYTGKKGKLWTIFSKYIRLRDFIKYGKCVSCGGQFDRWQDGQAGHYVAAGHCGFGLLFDEKNVNLQCAGCNNPVWSPDSSIPYGIELDKRYGKGTAKKLWERKDKEITKEYSQIEYDAQIKKYETKFNKLLSKIE